MNKTISSRQFNFNSVSAFVFIALGALLFFIAPSQIDEPLIKIGFGTNLSPELFPRLVAISFFGLGIWLLIASFQIRQRNQLRELDREAITNVVVTLILMAGYVYVMVYLGFVVGSTLMILAMSTYFGNRNFYLAGIVAVAIPVIIFVLFTKVLITSLPPFPVDEVIPSNWIIYDLIKYISNHSII